jgi:hypothetical protein
MRRLRAGDWVEVRSVPEILATLDERSRVSGLPFMPEMLQFCGKRVRVCKSAFKTCDTIKSYRARRMADAVHLEGLRCDGAAHNGCEQACLIFWKTAWLRPVSQDEVPAAPAGSMHPGAADGSIASRLDALQRHTRAWTDEADGADDRYCCQATEVLAATQPLDWWDPRQYVRDIVTRNVKIRTFIHYAAIAVFNIVWRRITRNPLYPYAPGLAQEAASGAALNLQPGDLVQVRSREEILRTLNKKRDNLGLSFDVEMEPFCGKTFRVLKRVEKLIHERTGKMVKIRRDCIVLDGVTCGGCLSRNRMFCPRAIYPYWREIWLRRVQ